MVFVTAVVGEVEGEGERLKAKKQKQQQMGAVEREREGTGAPGPREKYCAISPRQTNCKKSMVPTATVK